jgi:tetratricopeptide (TPR) repeat protein
VIAGRVPEAAQAGARALELVSEIAVGDQGRAYVALADVFIASGDRARARGLYEKGLDLLIEHARPYALETGRRYADLLEAEGDTAGALRVLRRATDAAAPVTSLGAR